MNLNCFSQKNFEEGTTEMWRLIVSLKYDQQYRRYFATREEADVEAKLFLRHSTMKSMAMHHIKPFSKPIQAWLLEPGSIEVNNDVATIKVSPKKMAAKCREVVSNYVSLYKNPTMLDFINNVTVNGGEFAPCNHMLAVVPPPQQDPVAYYEVIQCFTAWVLSKGSIARYAELVNAVEDANGAMLYWR